MRGGNISGDVIAARFLSFDGEGGEEGAGRLPHVRHVVEDAVQQGPEVGSAGLMNIVEVDTAFMAAMDNYPLPHQR